MRSRVVPLLPRSPHRPGLPRGPLPVSGPWGGGCRFSSRVGPSRPRKTLLLKNVRPSRLDTALPLPSPPAVSDMPCHRGHHGGLLAGPGPAKRSPASGPLTCSSPSASPSYRRVALASSPRFVCPLTADSSSTSPGVLVPSPALLSSPAAELLSLLSRDACHCRRRRRAGPRSAVPARPGAGWWCGGAFSQGLCLDAAEGSGSRFCPAVPGPLPFLPFAFPERQPS